MPKVDTVNKSVLAIACMMFLVSASMAAAQEMEMEVVPTVVVVDMYEKAPFVITVKNGFETKESFYLFVSGYPSNWKNIDASYIELPGGYGDEFNLYFYPNDKPGTYDYEVFFQSARFPEKVLKQDITLVVQGEVPDVVEVTGHEIAREGDRVNIDLTVGCRNEQQATIEFSVVSDTGRTISTATQTYTVQGEQQIRKSLPIGPDPPASTYAVHVLVKETGQLIESAFKVEPVRRVVQTEEERDTPLYHEVRIKVENEGNIVEEGYKVSSNVPTGFVSFNTEPAECQDAVCEWILDTIGPDGTHEIIYRVEYWPLILEGVVITVLVVAFLFFGVGKVTSPRLVKRIEDRGGEGYTTVLEIKNTGKKISNVVVRDQVSPLFKVMGEFETIKPAIKQTEEGTELVWTLGSIEPRDHRIVHYVVQPVISGKLRMQPAYMRYDKPGGKRSKVSSKGKDLAA